MRCLRLQSGSLCSPRLWTGAGAAGWCWWKCHYDDDDDFDYHDDDFDYGDDFDYNDDDFEYDDDFEFDDDDYDYDDDFIKDHDHQLWTGMGSAGLWCWNKWFVHNFLLLLEIHDDLDFCDDSWSTLSSSFWTSFVFLTKLNYKFQENHSCWIEIIAQFNEIFFRERTNLKLIESHPNSTKSIIESKLGFVSVHTF